MASRENQGFQIALIVFVMLAVLLSLTTFVFFRNYQNEKKASDEATANASKATQRATDLQNERDQYLTYLGVPTSEKKETIDDVWKKDMAVSAAILPNGLPEDQKTYKKVVERLQDAVR